MDEWLDRYKGYVLMALAALVLMGGVALATRRPDTVPLAVRTPPASPTVAVLLRVHVSGAVANVGVYSFRVGDRVEDAVAAAGGFTAEANPDGINLAARLADGQLVVIPKKGEPSTSLPSAGASAATRARGSTSARG